MKKRYLRLENLESRRVFAATDLPGPDWKTVIVSLNDNVGNPRAVAQDAVKMHGGQLGHVYEHSIKGFSAQLPAAAIAALAKNPQVKLIEPDLQMQGFAQTIPTGIERIAADKSAIAKINGIDGTVASGERINVNIAVIDTGIDATHPDLNVLGGVRFRTVNSGPVRNRGTFEDSLFNDDNGHGSHVAGIAAALDNGIGTVGVAPGARLWGVKVLDANGTGFLSDIIKGIDWVTRTRTDADPNNDIDVANMSLGGQGASTAYHNAIKESVEAGVVYIVAAGNSYRDILGTDFAFGTSDDTIPAAYPEVATISAFADADGEPGNLGGLTQFIDPANGRYQDDTFADFSNFSNSRSGGVSFYTNNNKVSSPGLGIDMMMPGVDIYSTSKNGGYARMSGTSMAAPHAAGLAALYIAQNGRATTAAGVYTIRQALIDGGKGWKSPEGLYFDDPAYIPDSPDNHLENLGWAGASVPTDQAPTINITSPTNQVTVFGTVLIEANATDDRGIKSVAFFVGEASIGVDTNGNDGWSVPWDTRTLSDGPVTLMAMVTDSGDQTATSIVGVTVSNPPMPSSMYVADLDRLSTTQGKTWSAFVTVTIRDSSQNPVAAATVTGTWSGGASGSVLLQTDAQGMVTFSKTKLARTATAAVFTVTNVTGTLMYSAVMNRDPDNDSNGTTISINNPFNTALSLNVSETTIVEPLPTKPRNTNTATVVEVTKTPGPLTTEKKSDPTESSMDDLSLLIDDALRSLFA